MIKLPQRIAVAFANLVDPSWMAGGQYLFNLLYALKVYSPDIERVLRVWPGTHPQQYQILDGLIERVFEFPTSIPAWLSKVPIHRLYSTPFFSWQEDRVLQRNRIDVQFMTVNPGTARKVPSVTWLPDFQHLHYPEFFSQSDLNFRLRFYPEAARKSRLVILSSYAALQDLEKVAPDYITKARVLSFVAQIEDCVYEHDPSPVILHYHLPHKFYFLPNQFWQHKNHLVVIQAVARARLENPQITVVCSGGIYDHRNPFYFESILNEIARLGLYENIRILGRISRHHLYQLMRHSLAILQPSLFEGWSTTVEEAKSLGKQIILSDIPVHREQNPPGALFFNPRNPEELAQLLLAVFQDKQGGPDTDMEERARQHLPARTKEFADKFRQIILEAIIK